jgi:outer membrane protein assembly factor BamB
MRKGSFLIGVSLLVLLPSAAAIAAPQLQWTRRFPGWVMAVDTSSSGITAVAGSRWAPEGHQTMSIVVYGPLGGQRWHATWRPAGESAIASAVAVASDGSIYVGGHRTGVDVFETETWWFLRRYSANGTLLWHREQSPAQHEMAWGEIHSIATRSGGVVVAGAHTGCCDVSAGQEGWIRAFGSRGTLLWTNPFEAPGIPARTQDLVWDVTVARGAIYAGGYIAIGTQQEPWRDQEAVVARLTSSGSLAWAHVFRDPGIQDDFDAAVSITVAGGRPVAAFQMNATMSAWTRLVRFRPDTGDVRWSNGTNGWPTSVEGTAAGSLYLLSRHPETYLLRRFGPKGNPMWSSGDLGKWMADISVAARRLSLVGDNPSGPGSRIWRYHLS